MTKGSIKIVGLGPGNPQQISLEALETLAQAEVVLLRTAQHPTVALLDAKGIKYTTCDAYYEKAANFEAVYQAVASEVLALAATKQVVYAVPGSPLVAEKTVVLLRQQAKEQGIQLTVLPAMSFLDLVYTALGIDPISGVRVIDAADQQGLRDVGKYPLIITQVYSPMVAGELKINLMDRLEDDTPIYFCRKLGLPDEELREIPLYELDRQPVIDHLTTVYIPQLLEGGNMDVHPLIGTVRVLREPNGCPWDREQNHASLRKGLVEEVYELLEAIDDEDAKGLREELGDVLLQVVFHARLAEEDGVFTMQDVIDDVVGKLVHRHPHVFGTVQVTDSAEVLKNWEVLKAEEKTERTHVLDGIAKGLPSLMRAYKLQKKAAKVGFDWPEKAEVVAKLDEELKELQEAVAQGESSHIEEELGDVFFTLVNYARHLGLEPETTLNKANNKFQKRFEFIEAQLQEKGAKWENCTLSDLDELWNQAKITKK